MALPRQPRRPRMCAGPGYSLARPMMVRMYRKMLMMSVYRFSAANTYSSGLRDSCLFPSSSWVSTARNWGDSTGAEGAAHLPAHHLRPHPPGAPHSRR